MRYQITLGPAYRQLPATPYRSIARLFLITICLSIFVAGFANVGQCQSPALFAITDDGKLYELDPSDGSITSARTQLQSSYRSTQSLAVAYGKFYASYDEDKLVTFAFTANDETDLGASGEYNIEGLAKHPNGKLYAAVSDDNDASLTCESLATVSEAGTASIVASPFNISPTPGDAYTRDFNSLEIDLLGRFFVGMEANIRAVTFSSGGDTSYSSPTLAYPGGSSAVQHDALARGEASTIGTVRMNASDTSSSGNKINSYEQGTSTVSLVSTAFATAGLQVAGMAWGYKCSDVDTDLYLQNDTFTSDAVFVAEEDLIAGEDVDAGQTAGELVVDNAGASVTFKAGDLVKLDSGFAVEAGSDFRVYIEEHPCI